MQLMQNQQIAYSKRKIIHIIYPIKTNIYKLCKIIKRENYAYNLLRKKLIYITYAKYAKTYSEKEMLDI